MAVSDKIEIKHNGVVNAISGTAVLSTNSTSNNKLEFEDDAQVTGDLYVGVGGNVNSVINIDDDAVHTGNTGVLDTAATISNPSVPNPSCGSTSGGNCSQCGNLTYNDTNVTISSDMRLCKFTLQGNTIASISGDVTIVTDDEFKIEDNAELRLLSGATLEVHMTDGKLKVQDNGKLNANTTTPSRVVLYHNQNDRLEIKGNGIAYATITHPNNELKIKNNGRFYGSSRGKKVKVEDNGEYHVDTGSCAVEEIDHFQISHDGSASTCFAESITISAHDSDGDRLTSYTGTASLSTSTSAGDWSVGGGGANGTLTAGGANSGSATYAFAAADDGQVTLQLTHTSEATLSVNVSEGSTSESSSADPNLVVGACSITGGVSCSVWYDASWSYRKAFVIDSSQVSTTLTNFPLLISLPSDSDLASHARTDGNDILFTAADGTTKLDHEIEVWNDSTGEIIAWVRVPSVSASSDQPVYLYYGNSGASNQSNAAGVWDSYYASVLHLHDDFQDSTSNNNHVTNSNTSDTAGKFGDGQEFDGSSDYLTPSTGVENRSEVTLSVWVDADETNDSNDIYNERWGSWYQFTIVQNKFYTRDSSNAPRGSRNNDVTWGPLTTGWKYLTFVYSVSTPLKAVYVDGALDASSTTSIDVLEDHENGKKIGEWSGSSDFDGVMDEFRLSLGIARSAGWIAAEYANQSNPAGFFSESLQHTSCAAGADHFSISHDGTALNCQAENVVIAVHDSSHNVDTSYTGTITLSTSTSHGDWSLVSGSGTLTNQGLGAGTYAFHASDSGQVTLGLRNTYAETLNINVAQSSTTESATEDANLAFAATGFVFLAGGQQNTIGTQIAGKSSTVAPGAQTIELQAVRTSDLTGACESFLTNTVAVGLSFECESPSTCATNTMTVNGTSVGGHNNGGTPSYTSVNLDFGNATDTTAAVPIRFDDVGRVQLKARLALAPSGETLTGSSNEFVVRPFGFDLDVTGNTAPSDHTGAVLTTAGGDFQVDARAVIWASADDTNNDGVPDGHNDTDPTNNANLDDNAAAANFGQAGEDVTLSAALVAPSGGNDPGISGDSTIGTFSSGAGSTLSARYAEVGIVELSAAISDGDYLGIGTSSSAQIAGRSGRVGRFTPHTFGVSYNTPRFNPGCASGSFTYLDQPFGFETSPVITVTAQAATGATTQNYAGSWWKLTNSSLANRAYTAASGTLNTTGLPSTSSDPAIAISGNGVGTLTFASGSGLLFSRGATPVGNFDAEVSLAIDIIDGDSVAFASNPARFGTASEGNGIAFQNGKSMRYGRLALSNAHGSELSRLDVRLVAEYYDGVGFQTNTADSCSSVSASDISLTKNPVTIASSATVDNDPLLLGDAELWLSAGGTGNSGTIDLVVDLSSSTGADLEWLRFDWPTDGDEGGTPNEDPTSRVTLGIYKGRDGVIYMRESY